MYSAGKGEPEAQQQKSSMPMTQPQGIQATKPNTPLSFTRPLGGQSLPLGQAMTSPTPTQKYAQNYDPRMLQELMQRG